MKAIIVAAGRGRRLGPETAAIPKCMVEVAGKAILHRQLDALEAAGVTDIVIVRGYLGDRITARGRRLRFVENPDWETNNILASLLYAEAEMDDDFLFSYSDIVYAPEHARRVASAAAPVALIVDRLWHEAYAGREKHPISEAELTRLAPEAGAGALPRVARVGKRLVPREEAAGEFSGLAKFSREGARALREAWTRALRRGGLDAPFGAAASLRQAYVTDGLNQLIADGITVGAVLVDGQWREIDTEEDLARAHGVVDTWG